MNDLACARLALDRVLVVSDRLERITDNERLAALVKARGSRLMTLTVSLQGDHDLSAVRSRLARFIKELVSPATIPLLDVHVVDSAEPVENLLETHQALLTSGVPGDHTLIIGAWQRGLCVVNSVEQARRVATFEDDYFDGDRSPAVRRWYSIMEGSPLIVTNPQHVVLEYGARINPRAAIFNENEVSIGRGSLLGADAELNLYTAKFVMGQFCQTSSYFAAIGSRHTLHFPSTFSVSRGPYAFLGETADKVGDIVIGNDVWFGTRVVVLPGVHVADGCVIGAGSVVTESLTEPYGIYAGNPAKLIRFRFPPHVIKWLCAIQWWNWSTKKLWEARSFFRTDLSDKTEEDLRRLIAC